MTDALTNRIAGFAVDPRWEELPDEAAHAVRRAILDSVGVAVAGAAHRTAALARDMVRGLGAPGPCRVVGSDLRTDAVNAALLNGVSAHVLDWDDTILPTRAHLSAALLPPLMALGEGRGWTLADISPAFAVGFEIQSRLNHALYPSIADRGWQGTGVVGGIGTASAVGRMLGLDEARVCHAIGIAATNASGLVATFGSMSKALNIGRAGASGLQSALLADLGFTSNPDILGTGGFLALYDDAPDVDLLTGGLGERWSIQSNGYKIYPCGFVAHAMLDAVLQVRSKVPQDAVLNRLVLRVAPEALHLMGNPDPRTELEAKFSLHYDAAAAWLDGRLTPASFEASAVTDPRYRTVMAITELVRTPELAQHEALAEAELADGSVVRVHVDQARGTARKPFSDGDLLEKFASAFDLGGQRPGDLGRRILEDRGLRLGEIMDYISHKP